MTSEIIAMHIFALFIILTVSGESTAVDPIVDETEALNADIQVAAQNQAVCEIPAGLHWINPEIGLRPVTGSRIVIHPRAVLKAIPVAAANSRIVLLDGVTDVTIWGGGTLIGERDKHLATDGEWGMGFEIRNCERVLIRNITVKDCWGDGFYVSDSKDIGLTAVRSEHNRRQGLSIVSGERITVRGSTFEQTDGTLPMSGIAIEPNAGSVVQDVQIVNCVCLGNNGRGIHCVVPDALVGQATVQRVLIDRCTIQENGCDVPAFGIQIQNTKAVTVSNCLVIRNRGIGIGAIRSTGTQVTGCTVRGTYQTSNKSDAGVLFSEDQDSDLTGNRIVENETIGLFLNQSTVRASRNVITRNRISLSR